MVVNYFGVFQRWQCAIHNFPHNIDHCLGLARSEFIGNFTTVMDSIDMLWMAGICDG